jgi:hypothetical protein
MKEHKIFEWLRGNLGPSTLVPLTGTDSRALVAATEIIEVYSYAPSQDILNAFATIVRTMQPKCREFAYHAIAHVMNWEDRPRLWAAAGLDPIEKPWRCKFES